MPTEAVFLLAGLAILIAVGGWAFGQFLDRDGQLPTRISADYIRGLNLVLSRKTDEALELFIQMAKVDDETLETHFALGHLFQRRGEVERAIRVHQNLLARPNLNDMQHDQAVFALAEDYLGAGLFDRAETLFEELQDSETQAQPAIERLVYIYEREREWQKAVETHRRLEMLTGTRSPQVSHYYCELAEDALQAHEIDQAREFLKSTIRSETGALRGNLIRARIARNEGKFADAIRYFEQVVAMDSAFVSEVLGGLLDCYHALNKADQFEHYVAKFAEQNSRAVHELAYAAITLDLSDSPALVRCIESFLADSEVLGSIVDIDALRRASAPERERALARISKALRKLALSSARYRCGNCGYSTQQFVWHCPSCKLWETIKPIQRFQLETTLQ
jgi:lipopolysaccharide biosynthesis regulator YciM